MKHLLQISLLISISMFTLEGRSDVIEVDGNKGDYVFQADNTYHVIAPVNISGTATFEGGAVIKYSQSASINVNYPGTVKMLSSAYRPVVFTSENDNTVGASIGSGTPSSYDKAITFLGSSSSTSFLSLTNFRILYANTAIQASGTSLIVTLTDGQIVNCGTGYTGGQAVIGVNNVLMAKFLIAFTGSFMNVHAKNCTFDGVYVNDPPAGNNSFLVQGDSGNVVFYATNCVVANVSIFTTGPSVTGGYNGFYRNGFNPNSTTTFGDPGTAFTSGASPFQTVGGGKYYLNTFRHVGTTFIDTGLLTDLRQKTTQPPPSGNIKSGTAFSADQKFAQASLRDTGTGVDLGYHYDVIDWALANCSAATNLVIAPGTVIATYANTDSTGNKPALTLNQGSQLFSVGTPTEGVWIVEYNTVQESPGSWQRTTGGSIVSKIPIHTPNPRVNCRFTKWSMLAQDDTNFLASAGSGPLSFRDCEFYGGKVRSIAPTLNLANCLFDRVQIASAPTDIDYASYLQNNTFHGGTITLTAPDWVIKDNILDKTALTITGSHIASHNAYVNVSPYGAVPGDTSPIPLTASPTYAVGPLGLYYLDSNNNPSLINGDATIPAGSVGLYHYTVKIDRDGNQNQIKDGSDDTKLSIGYHYVALNSANGPIDTDSDTVADYLENYTGDGQPDPLNLNPLDIASFNSANSYRHVPSTLYPTIRAAYYGNPPTIPAAGPGDIILVENGTYTDTTENLYLRSGHGGSAGAPLTIRAVTIGGAVIDPQNQNPGEHNAAAIFIEADYHKIQGFEIRNGPRGGVSVFASHNQILNNEIHNNGSTNSFSSQGQSGIYSSYGTSQNSYVGNYVHDNGRIQLNPPSGLDHGLYLSGQNEIVVNNVIASNSAYGIQVSGADPPAPSMQIYNNTIVLNRNDSGIVLYVTMGAIDIANNIFFYNGTVVNPGHRYGITTCAAAGGPVQIRNNLFYANPDGARRDGSSTCDDGCNNCPNCLAVFPSANDPAACNGAQNDNPMFVSQYSDWHIGTSEPYVVGAGLNLHDSSAGTTDYDYDGKPRSATGNYDLGAYVYVPLP